MKNWDHEFRSYDINEICEKFSDLWSMYGKEFEYQVLAESSEYPCEDLYFLRWNTPRVKEEK